MKTIVDITEEYGLEIKKEGTVMRSYCPFHNDTGRPNFTIYPETDSWYCFACGIGGDVIQFVSKIENISYEEAKVRVSGVSVELEELQQKLDGVEIEKQSITFNDDLNVVVSRICRKYLQKHSEQSSEVLTFLKQFDTELLNPITYKKMLEILKSTKQKFGDCE